MHRNFFSCLFLTLLATAGAPVFASADGSVAERVANQRSLRASVEQNDGKFARLKADDKSKLLRAQDRIFALLDGKNSVTALSEDDLARLHDAETEIAGLVASLDPPAGKAKVVCSYQARLGSNRKERVCRKVGSSDSRDAREAVRRMQTR
ncbi:MAG: hypothetical protein ABIP49_07075 [Lysobacterales bacterium]